MDGKQKMSVAVTCIAIAVLALTAVTASPKILSSTPLYTFRMEQASRQMNFLSTPTNDLIYTTENGCVTLHGVAGHGGGVNPLRPCTDDTCMSTCESTCVNSCNGTCVNSCNATCVNSCYGTCGTCQYTCYDSCWPDP